MKTQHQKKRLESECWKNENSILFQVLIVISVLLISQIGAFLALILEKETFFASLDSFGPFAVVLFIMINALLFNSLYSVVLIRENRFSRAVNMQSSILLGLVEEILNEEHTDFKRIINAPDKYKLKNKVYYVEIFEVPEKDLFIELSLLPERKTRISLGLMKIQKKSFGEKMLLTFKNRHPNEKPPEPIAHFISMFDEAVNKVDDFQTNSINS